MDTPGYAQKTVLRGFVLISGGRRLRVVRDLSLVGMGGTARSIGGTVIIENTGETAVKVAVTVKSDEYDRAIETYVSGGESRIGRGFGTADEGDVVRLAARLGNEGDRVEFEFFPAADKTEHTPPEVTRRTFENAVKASAIWSAIGGKYASEAAADF